MREKRRWVVTLAVLSLLCGCVRSPEDGRPSGGGHGADAGNHGPNIIDPPSKLDGTKDLGPLMGPSDHPVR